MKYIILSSLFGILFSLQLKAQNDTIDNRSYYFDDGLNIDKGIIKLGLFTLVEKELQLSYEFPLTTRFTIESGAGLIFPSEEESSIGTRSATRELGYSLLLHPKYYILQDYPESFNMGFLLKRHAFELDNVATDFVDFTIMFANQWIIGNRYTIEGQYGFGLRSKSSNRKSRNEDALSLLQINIGIIL